MVYNNKNIEVYKKSSIYGLRPSSPVLHNIIHFIHYYILASSYCLPPTTAYQENVQSSTDSDVHSSHLVVSIESKQFQTFELSTIAFSRSISSTETSG